jgi:preprotein translocase subunit SecE
MVFARPRFFAAVLIRDNANLRAIVLNSRVEPSKNGTSAGDLLKYVLCAALIAGGLFVFYWFNGQWPSVVRVLSVVAGLIAAGVLFMTTAKGAQTREFLSESRFELRKVVWPTRQEALRTTWVVMIAVVLISLILAGFDQVISFAVQWLLSK